MSIRESAVLIGKGALYTPTDSGLRFAVRIEDVRSSYGRIDYLVRPEIGTGEAWVGEGRVEIGEVAGDATVASAKPPI